ncbi:MAG: hypothetical protein J1F68_02465 [Clostridiales bacterium]|nr:hypothetical protein [Clostridiales bacterium]
MTEKDIQKISEQYKDEKTPLYKKIHERVEDMIVQQARKRKRIKTFYKTFPVALAMVLVISLAIVLPIVLQPNETTPGGAPSIWYSDSDITSQPLPTGDTLKKYVAENNESFLYIDMYEVAEDIDTQRYYKKDDESITVYLQETFTHTETGYFIRLTVKKNNIIVESLDNEINEPQTLSVNNVTVYYGITRQDAIAQFEYDGYKYYLGFADIDEYFTVEFIAEIISNMFGTQQAVA